MKILTLRFKNLNSLVGEWTIDFTHPRYNADGIFAISGPTGAGKSTILDAICLALYGRTPRLKTLSSTTNEIMAYNTGECLAEVVFETQNGKFRTCWSQSKARKKANGNLQQPSFEISDAVTGKVIANHIDKTKKVIEDSTGMDFNRFTQSMLLAQGGFAKFLLANANERAPLLEEITGTEIYSQISMLVYDRTKIELDKLKDFKAETEGVLILNDEEIKQLNDDLTSNKAAETELAKQQQTTSGLINWLNGIEKLNTEIAALHQQEAINKNNLEAFQPQRLILDRANNANAIELQYLQLTNERRLQNKDIAELELKKEELPKLNEQINIANEADIKAKAELQKLISEAEVENKAIVEVRKMDVEIDNAASNLKATTNAIEGLKLNKSKAASEIELLQSKINNTTTAATTARKYIVDNASDQELIQQFEAIKISLLQYESKLNAKKNAENDLLEAQTLLTAAEKSLEKQQEQIKETTNNYEQAQKIHLELNKQIVSKLNGRRVDDYKYELNYAVEKLGLLKTIQSLEAHRQSLQDGHECPLCGSLQHPFAEGNIPQTTETEKLIADLKNFIAAIDLLEKQQTAAERQQNEALIALETAKAQLDIYKNNVKNATDNLVAKQDFFQKLTTELEGQLTSLRTSLKVFGVEQIDNVRTIITALQNRLDTWNAYAKMVADSEETIKDFKAKADTQNELLKEVERQLQEEQNKFELQEIHIKNHREKRKILYGDKNPETEEKRINNLLALARQKEKNAENGLTELKGKLEGLQKRIAELTSAIELRKTELEGLELQFADAKARVGFVYESDFLAARMKADERESLIMKAKALDDKTTELKTLKSEKEKSLAAEQDRKLTEQPLEELNEKLEELKSAIAELLQKIGAAQQKLADNENAIRQKGAKIAKYEKQKEVWAKWEALNNLIGQKDGAKYSRFAQGITFEIMVAHANKELRKLNDRYLLVRDVTEPLDLNIIDNYQAGECRSTKNLSGGESFIVSLALALGLSSISSKNVKIDTLFLDEGFGTLDEDTLGIALSALSNLKQEGKLIGVISHVGSFRERINTQIEVIKGTGGVSTLIGPGCKKNN